MMTRREALSLCTAGGTATLAFRSGAAATQQQLGNDGIPPGTVALSDFERVAEERVDAQAYELIRGGAADEITLRWNREAFQRIKLSPRVLVDVSELDTRVTLFGQQLPFPILIAPTGAQGYVHPEGELETARGAAEARAVQVISMRPTRPIEDVAGAASQPPWYQLYVRRDREEARDLVQRAEDAGCRVLCLTVDSARPGVRNFMMRAPFPTTRRQLGTNVDRSLTWDIVSWLSSITKMPVVLKGIVDPGDAARAVEEGAAGIIVSNHGGRNLDTVPATVEALPRVVEVIDGRIPVLMDGGVRRGTDVIKALALGARAVLIGRPYLYGLGVGGAEGVRRVVTILREELEINMALMGRPTVGSIDRSALWVEP